MNDIASLHWRFKERFNKLNSNHYTDLRPIQIDEKLNAAQIFFCEHFGEVSKFPFEATAQRLEMLAPLVVKFEEEGLITTYVTSDDNVYQIDTEDLSYNYWRAVRAEIVTSTTDIPVSFVKHDKLSHLLSDPMQKPSLSWRRALATIAKTSDNATPAIYIYAPTTITGVKLEYIKRPTNVFFGNYNTPEYVNCINNEGDDCNQYYSTTTDQVHLELSYDELIVDIAVYLATGKTENVNLLQIVKEKISSIT